MNILSKLKPASGSKAPTTPEIAERIRTTEAEVARLDGELGEVALAEFLGAPGAAEKATALSGQLMQLRETLAKLKRAQVVALEHEEAEQRRVRVQLARTQIRNVKEALAARDEAAVAMNAALAEACQQFKTLVAKSTKARSACPLGMEWPAGSLCEFSDLHRLVEETLWKFGANPTLGARDHFPGAKTTFDLMHQPERIPDLPDTIKASSAHVLAVLDGRVKE